MPSRVRSSAGMLTAVLLCATPFVADSQQATGAVEGRILENGSNRPLAGAQVFISGTAIGAVSTTNGIYRIAGAPARQVEIRVRLLGYAPASKTAVVTAGQTSQLDFDLQVSALQLEQVVVTGSGQATEVKRLGNTVAVLQPPPNAPINDISNLLTAREPGLVGITGNGNTGEGVRIRIRGNASITQSNEPIVFLDGVRINSGGTQTSRVDDIDPSTIERVEVLKGAAAATLYGTEASNGVIQIFTKKGSTGAPRWNVQLSQEGIQFNTDRIAPNSAYAVRQSQADSLAQFWGLGSLRPFEVFEVPIFDRFFTETGSGTIASASIDGGGPAVTYFGSARYQYEDGPLGAENLGPATDKLRRIQTGVNLSLVPTSRMRIGVRNSYYNVESDIPANGNSIYGVYSLANYARPDAANCAKSTRVAPGRCSGAGNPFGNVAFMTARESMQQINNQHVSRFNGAIDASYKPFSELSVDLIGGYDFTNLRDIGFSRFRYDLDEFTQLNVEGSRGVTESRARVLTLDGKAAWNRALTNAISSAFVAGLQVFNARSTSESASSTNFPGPGIAVVGAGGANLSIGESFSTTINGGYFAQEQVGFRDWIFATVGGRYDFASAFGEDSPGVFYPKASLSFVPSDMDRWSSPLGINTLRLRAAWGRSGRQPGAFDKFTTFSPLRSELGAGLVPSQLGNQNLKPEVATEVEGGFELGLFDNRLGVDVTGWHRTVNDLLIDRQFPVSGGFRRAQLDNIGEIKANGVELSLKGFALNRPSLSVDLFASGSYMKQWVVSLGGAPPLKVDAAYNRLRGWIREGAPLGALYTPLLARPCPGGGTPARNKLDKNIACYGPDQFPIILNNATNPDGSPRAATRAELLAYLAQPRDLRASSVQNSIKPLLADYDGTGNLLEQFNGDIFPDWTGTFGTNVTVRRNWRFQTVFEFRTGFFVQDLTDAFRASQHASIGSNVRAYSEIEAAINNPASTPEQRLEAVDRYIRKHRRLIELGLSEVEPGDFMRWRELALTYDLGPALAARIRARSLSITGYARNLALWTKYPGVDPELTYAGRSPGGGIASNYRDAIDAFGMPVPRRFGIAVNYGF